MYNVSEEYRAQVHSEVIKTRMTFEIDGTTYTDDNIVKGSFAITNQCTDTKDVKIGAVYVGQMSATFRGVNIARNLWRGKEITVTFWLQIDEDDDTWEDVPLGVFTVSEAQWKASGVVVKAFDNMAKFDKPFSLNQSGGLLCDFLAVASSECDVDLAQTEEELKALPNGMQYFSYYSASDVETWRDLISYIAQCYGGFATIDRTGKLAIRRYTQTAVDSLPTTNRFTGGTFSDYVTKYTAISYVHINTKELRRYAASVDDGATMELGANPFLQNKLQTNNALPNILSAVQLIQYTPFSFTSASNPAYDLGDVVSCNGGIAGTTAQKCCIQKYVLQYHKAFRIQGFGADPNLSASRSKTDKSISGLTSSTSAAEMGFYEIRNVEAYNIEENQRRRILSLRVASTVKTRVHFHFNINLQATDTDENDITRVIATYIENGTEKAFQPEETYIDGKHVLHLMYIMPMLNNEVSILSLFLTAVSGTIKIEREGAWAYASGAGLAGDEEWEGTFDLFDDATLFDISEEYDFDNSSEGLLTTLLTPTKAELSETEIAMTIADLSYSETITETLRIINYERDMQRLLENDDERITEAGDYRYTERESN